MAVDPFSNIILSLFDLLKGSFVVFVVVFFIVLVAQKLRKKIAEETNWSWFISAFATTIIVVFILTLIVYFLPFLSASQQLSINQVPEEFSPNIGNFLESFLLGILKSFIVTAVLSVFLMAFEFIGLFLFQFFSSKLEKQPNWLKLGLAVYSTVVLTSAIILFLVPEVILGLFYFLYFGL
ncbi:MAG: hypothetical protein COV47_04610 [Candidatus Diapherotrites archaeon CG11_big_fil_rev_8_21_14_0_20_37_9]|nr:MAG: hypothetical protein COV47_04610 [Candidatus Diapherotrites archaeon CG11_big_fil_rev_8_21_14_0_20_37_9]